MVDLDCWAVREMGGMSCCPSKRRLIWMPVWVGVGVVSSSTSTLEGILIYIFYIYILYFSL